MPRQLFAARFEENTPTGDRWKIYLACLETGKINICAQKGDNGAALNFRAQNEEACAFFVENLLWGSPVETTLLLVPERAFMRGFEALEEARVDERVDSLSVFEGVLSRTELEEYVKQICDVSVV